MVDKIVEIKNTLIKYSESFAHDGQGDWTFCIRDEGLESIATQLYSAKCPVCPSEDVIRTSEADDYYCEVCGHEWVHSAGEEQLEPEGKHCTTCGYSHDPLLNECPTCLKHSAREEVYVECGKNAQTHYVVSTKAETDMAYIPVRKLTHPTVSEEEIYKYLSKFWDFMEDAQIDDTQGQWSIKDLIQAYMKKQPLRN